MSDGGGTVAGESPDKAEQRERESAVGDDGRDPRLSVLRDRVDQPTAVFRALAPRTAPEDGPSVTEDATEDPAVAEESAAAAADPGAARDSVAGADGDTGAVDAEDPGTAEPGTEDAPSDGGPSDGGPSRAASSEDVPSDGESSEAASSADPAGKEPGAGAAAGEAAGDGDGAEAGRDEGVAGDGGEDGEAAAGAAPAGSDGTVVLKIVTKDVPEASKASEASEDAPNGGSAAEGAPEALDGAADAPGAKREGPAAGDEAAEAPAASEADEAPAADRAADATSWFAARKAAAEAAAEEKPKAEPEPADEPKAEPADVAEPEPVDEPDPADKPEPADKADPAGEAEAGDEPGAKPVAPPVDQPTAVFKAVKPPVAPPVDQPTTALKLPPSTFRPLKGDITQEQPKPEPRQQPAAEAGARTTPAPAPAPASLSEPERTRQQPLPPRPPLEILAELTNTPPPPETALRTTARRVKIWTPLLLLLVVVFAVVQFVRPLPDARLVLSAAPTYTFEGGPLQMPWPSEGQGAAEVEGVGSLGTYGAQKPAPIASVAKTMTAYVILRDHPIKGSQKGPEIEVDRTAGEQAKAKDESTAPIKEGQTYSQKELLQLLMIPSGNNVARLLARWDAGSEAAFVEKMNAAAKELGMTGSTYTDPSGLQSTTMSTPLDQLKLGKAVMQFDVFREIVDMPYVEVDGIPGRIENNNKILLEPGVTGIKTGSSTPAGGNLLWAANTVVDGQKRRILGIVMGAKDAPQLYQKLDLAIANSLKVIQKAQSDVTSAAVVKKGQVVGYVDDGLGGRTPVVSTKDLKAVGWPGLKVDLALGAGGKAVPHHGRAGDVVGQVSIGTGTGQVSAPVALQKDLVEPGFGEKLTRLG
ncbi:D-alanyl-D-alanine carboxypeptidase [Streptomyces sp. NPDC048018]|uniref:D-alanyl-D-alanine carboxypeptidase n=1 Tax=Streptomyces sp. NPDC048018 TaxID=3365499 RepID=UPI00371826AB